MPLLGEVPPGKGPSYIDTAAKKADPAVLAHEIGHHLLQLLGKNPPHNVQAERDAWAVALKMFRDAGVKPTDKQMDMIRKSLITYKDPKTIRQSIHKGKWGELG
jgi:hypothetical protein